MRAAVLEKLRAVASARTGSAPAPEPRPQPAPVPEPVPVPVPAPPCLAGPPLEAAVCFDVPGVGDVWLVPTAGDAERLGIPRGQWITPEQLLLLEPLEVAERKEVLQWMRATGGVILAAPAAVRYPSRGRRGAGGLELDSDVLHPREGGVHRSEKP
jgi:hypothetical protein